jgi:hypothetical protein
VVNCVAISSQLKESPVHVPLHMEKDSHIMCEQIFTVSKTELTDFMGNVPNSILLSVKAKLRIQFDMSTVRNTELFNNIKKSIDELNTNPEIMDSIKENLEMLNEKADKGFGVPNIENDFLGLVMNLENSIKKLIADVEELKSANGQGIKKADVEIIPKETPGIKTEKTKKKRREYTHEDKVFIADKNNSIKSLMEKYGYDKTTAHKMRAYFKKRLADGKETKSSPQQPDDGSKNDKRAYRKLTEADKNFILDKNNSIETIMEKYDFDSRQAVSWKRASLKKSIGNKNKVKSEE